MAEVGIVVIYVNDGPGVGRQIALLLDTVTDVVSLAERAVAVVDCAPSPVVVAALLTGEAMGEQ